jgi:3-hydroxyacyl-CoA dehydrogenase
MGHGIAQEFAVAGYDVVLNDRTDELLQVALANVERNLRMMVAAGLVDAERAAAAPGRMRATTSLSDAVADADVVIEAVFEDLALKQSVFARLDEHAPEHAILASNSSTFMPSQMAQATGRPERVLVAHYFNPPHLLPLVEVVKGPQTSEEAARVMYDLLAGIGKQPVLVQKEAPGFIANRIQIAMQREALAIVERGIASPADVDRVVRASFGRRLPFAGPFEIADIAGLHTITAAIESLLPHIESSTALSPVLSEMSARGDLGVRSGRGFYEWSPEAGEELRQRIARGLIALSRLLDEEQRTDG